MIQTLRIEMSKALHRTRRQARRLTRTAGGRLRYVAGRLEGLAYRIRGGRPVPGAPDVVLAERARAGLGAGLKRRALTDVHVEVRQHTAYLRGHVPTRADAAYVEEMAMRVSGIDGVESYLDIGPLPPLTPVREDTIHLPSEAFSSMLALARATGCEFPHDVTAVRAVLSTLAERIPQGELVHVWAHLPPDLRNLLSPPHREGTTTRRIRHIPDFYATVAAAAGIDPEAAQLLTSKILRQLQALVPEEVRDIEAVLPTELKTMWSSLALS